MAEQLIGKRLVHRLPDGTRLSGRIVETEAYIGLEDPCCHSFSGRPTPRTAVMFGSSGFSYIYFIYGFYFCMNVVAGNEGVPEAVLIRALEPVEGVDLMRAPRPLAPTHQLANGPGKLCQALRLGREQNALDLTNNSHLWIEEDVDQTDVVLIEGPRIGLSIQHDAAHWPLRFGWRGNPSLSPPKFPQEP